MDVGGYKLLKTYINNTWLIAIIYNYLIAQLSIPLIIAYCILFKQYIPLYAGNMDCDCIIVSLP